jgi:hypothetical protein
MFRARVSRKHGRRQRPGRKSFSLNRAGVRTFREHEIRKVEWTCRARNHNLAQHNRNLSHKSSDQESPIIRKDHRRAKANRRAITAAVVAKAKAANRKLKKAN